MKVHLVQIVFLILTVNSVDGTRCLECKDASHPRDCGTITECTPGDVCYVEQYITYGGLILFNTGCKAKRSCSGITRGLVETFGTRTARNGDLVTCVQCCHGDFCNLEGCGQSATKQPQRGPICYSCTNQNGQDHCRDVVQCDVGQKCALSKLDYESFWTSSCSNDLQCDSLHRLHGAQNNTHSCVMCCATDFCNVHCQ